MRKQDQEQGYVVVVVAVLLFVFMSFAALAVDVGMASSARTAAQRAADAAALAGAFTFINNPTADQPDTAIAFATQVALNNQIFGEAIAEADVNVNVDVDNRRVTVTIANSRGSLFGGVFGRSTNDVAATGFAEASRTATGSGNPLPVFIPNTVLAKALDPNKTDCQVCSQFPDQLLIEAGEEEASEWVNTQIRNSSSTTISNRIPLKPRDPGAALRPGQFYLIEFPGTQPGDYPEIIGNYWSSPSFCQNTYSVLTGNHIGNERPGFEALIGCGSQGEPDAIDTYDGPAAYRSPDGTTVRTTSRALRIAPIWDVCGQITVNGTPTYFCPPGSTTENTFPGGTQVELRIVGFALLFVEGAVNGGGGGGGGGNGGGRGGQGGGGQGGGGNPLAGTPDCTGNLMVGRIVGVFGCSTDIAGGEGSIDPSETGPFSIPLRLVRVPVEE